MFSKSFDKVFQNGRVGLLLPPSWNTRDHIYHSSWNKQINCVWNNGFKTLDKRQWRTVISERWDTSQVNPVFAPACCLDRVSSPLHRKGDLRQSATDSLRRWSCDSKETKIVSVHRRVLERRELHRDPRKTPWSVQQNEGTTWIEGRTHLWGIKGNSLW